MFWGTLGILRDNRKAKNRKNGKPTPGYTHQVSHLSFKNMFACRCLFFLFFFGFGGAGGSISFGIHWPQRAYLVEASWSRFCFCWFSAFVRLRSIGLRGLLGWCILEWFWGVFLFPFLCIWDPLGCLASWCRSGPKINVCQGGRWQPEKHNTNKNTMLWRSQIFGQLRDFMYSE